jgi:hypothetical protein
MAQKVGGADAPVWFGPGDGGSISVRQLRLAGATGERLVGAGDGKGGEEGGSESYGEEGQQRDQEGVRIRSMRASDEAGE